MKNKSLSWQMPKCIPQGCENSRCQRTELCMLAPNILLVVSTAFAPCYPSGTQNFEVTPTFLVFLCTRLS